jgi:hypothetical protein
MFNTAKFLSIVSERTAKINDECGEKIGEEKLFLSNYLGIIVRKLKLPLQGRLLFRIRNCQVFEIIVYICINFSS